MGERGFVYFFARPSHRKDLGITIRFVVSRLEIWA